MILQISLDQIQILNMPTNTFESFEDQSENQIQEPNNQNNINSRIRRVIQWISVMWAIVKAWISQKKIQIYLCLTLMSMIYTFFSYSYYQKALKCESKDATFCLKTVLKPQGKKVSTHLMLVFTDCFIFLFYISAFIYKKTYRLFTFIGIVQHVYLFYTGPFQMSVFDMTGILKSAHYLIVIILVIFLILVRLVTFCWKKSAKYTMGGLLVFILIFYFIFISNQCYDWRTGINGQLQDREGSCNFEAPFCSVFKLISRFDFDFLVHNCFFGQQYKKVFDKHFSNGLQNGTIVGFSDIKNTNQVERVKDALPQTVFKYARRYKTFQEARIKHEVIFDTINQKYFIQVKPNITLAQQKQELYTQFQASSSPPLVKNVLLIYLDSVSRYETSIKLPTFVKWFQKQAKYKSYSTIQPKRLENPQEKAQAYEFYKYHSLGYTTFPNSFPIFYGKTQEEMSYKKQVNKSMPRFSSFHQEFSQRGFVTSFSSSDCATWGDLSQVNLQSTKDPTFDHQSFSTQCDPNFYSLQTEFGFAKGASAATDRCLYHKTLSQYAFQYASSFFDKYRNSSKMSQISLMQGHQFSGGSVRFLDKSITAFLQQMQQKGHLQQTLVVALSDHGQHLGEASRSIFSDHFHPFMYMSVPQKMNSKYRDGIRLNQQNLVTAYNFYHFMKHVAIGDSYKDKAMGLIGDLSFQKSCSAAKIPTEQNSTCNCK